MWAAQATEEGVAPDSRKAELDQARANSSGASKGGMKVAQRLQYPLIKEYTLIILGILLYFQCIP